MNLGAFDEACAHDEDIEAVTEHRPWYPHPHQESTREFVDHFGGREQATVRNATAADGRPVDRRRYTISRAEYERVVRRRPHGVRGDAGGQSSRATISPQGSNPCLS